jgi:hypothetical protein
MSSEEGLSSMILTNAGLIADIYNIVKESGSNAVSNDLVLSSKNNVNIIKPGIPGVNRSTTNCRASIPNSAIANSKACRRSNAYSIIYNSADIMIVGGAALNIYDYLLSEFKERREIETLENYLKKKTSDIDIVWWPRPSTDKEIIVSSSKAIENVVYIFKEELVKNFAAKKEELQNKLKPYIKDATLEINVTIFQVWRAGVWSVNIEFIVGENVLKICDISVHDSGSSQLYNSEGQIITDMRFMTNDPIYCDPRQGSLNSISYLVVNDIYVAVPGILSFIKQQMLAFDNLLRRNQEKAFINYKRVQFIKKLLQNIIITNSNKRNYKELIEVFKTDNLEHIQSIIININKREKESINKLRAKILELCGRNTDDTFIKHLCYRASVDEDALAHEYLSRISSEINTIKERITNKLERITILQFKEQYNNLLLYLEDVRKQILRLSSLELINNSRENPLKYVLEEEEKIDSEIKLYYKRITNQAHQMAKQQQRIAEERYAASLRHSPSPSPSPSPSHYSSDPRIQIFHYPHGTPMPPLPPGTPILNYRHIIPTVAKDPATGMLWYTDPYTMRIIVQDLETGRWRERDSPPPPPPFVESSPRGPPRGPHRGPNKSYSGRGKGTKKNNKNN